MSNKITESEKDMLANLNGTQTNSTTEKKEARREWSLFNTLSGWRVASEHNEGNTKVVEAKWRDMAIRLANAINKDIIEGAEMTIDDAHPECSLCKSYQELLDAKTEFSKLSGGDVWKDL